MYKFKNPFIKISVKAKLNILTKISVVAEYYMRLFCVLYTSYNIGSINPFKIYSFIFHGTDTIWLKKFKA